MDSYILKIGLVLILICQSICYSSSQENRIETKSISQDEIICLDDLRIHKFQNEDIYQAGKRKWKVVVGNSINYKARKSSGTDWNWELGSGECEDFNDFWKLETTMGNFSDQGRNAIIPLSSLPLSNTDFGDTNGFIKVSNKEEESCVKKDLTIAKAEVFFAKNDMNIHEPAQPNWFYYWSQAPLIENLLDITGFHFYDKESCTWSDSPIGVKLDLVYGGGTFIEGGNNTYGSSNFSIGSVNPIQGLHIYCDDYESGESSPFEYNDTKTITLYDGAGYHKTAPNCSTETEIYGIHNFYSTIVHEVEHAEIKCEVWNYTHPDEPEIGPGFKSGYDLDNDGYKDLWERKVGHMYGFMFEIDDLETSALDKYNANYTGVGSGSCTYDFCDGPGQGDCSAGTIYEEDRCRMKESLLDLDGINNFDWSWDKMNAVPGKKW